jgi:hypothetical protein
MQNTFCKRRDKCTAHRDVERQTLTDDDTNSDDGHNTIAKRLRGPSSRKPKSTFNKEGAAYVYYEHDKQKRQKEKDTNGTFYILFSYLFYKTALNISYSNCLCTYVMQNIGTKQLHG